MVAEATATAAAKTTPHAQQQQQQQQQEREAEAAVMAEVQQAYARVAERYRGKDDGHIPSTLTHIMRNEGTGVIYNSINRELVARRARVAALPAAAPSTSPLYKRVLSWHAALRRREHSPYYDTFFATDDVELRLWVEGVLEYYREKLTRALQRAGVSSVPAPPPQPSSDAATQPQTTVADKDKDKDKDSKAKKNKKKKASAATRRKRQAAAAAAAAATATTTTTAQPLTPATLHALFARVAARVTVDVCRSTAFAEAVDLASDLMQSLRVANALALLFVADAAVAANNRRSELFYLLHEYMGSAVWIEHYVALLIGTVCAHGRRVVQHLQQQQQQAARDVSAAAATAVEASALHEGSGGCAAADALLQSTVRDLYGLIRYCATFYGEDKIDVLPLVVLQCARYVGVLAFPPRSLVALVRERNNNSHNSNNNNKHNGGNVPAAAAAVVADDGNSTTATAPLVWTVAQWHADALVRYVTHDALYFARSVASFLANDAVRYEALMSVLLQQLLCFDMHGVRGGAAATAVAFADDDNDNDDEKEEQQRQQQQAAAAAARVAAAATMCSSAQHKRSVADEDDDDNEGDEDNDEEDEEDEEEEEDEEDENEEQPRGKGSNTAAPPSSQLTVKLSINAPAVLTQCCTRVQQQQQQRCSCFLGAALRVLLERVVSQLLSAHPSNVVHSATAAAAAAVAVASGDGNGNGSSGSSDQDKKSSTAARSTPAAAATTTALAAKSGGVRVVANSATAVADARAALLSLARSVEALVLPAQVQQPSWASLSLAAQDTAAVPFATTHFVAQMRSAMHACMLQLLRCVTATTTTAATTRAATTSVTEDVLLPFYAHLIHCEHIYYNLTCPVSTASSDTGNVTASAKKSAKASKNAPAAAAAAAATDESAQQHEPPTTPPLQQVHSIFYTAVAQALRACYPDNAGRALIVPIVNSMHTFLMQQEDDGNNNNNNNSATTSTTTAAATAAAVRMATVPGVVALSSVDALASVARLVRCVAERDTFLRKYTDVCQRRLLARHAPGRHPDDVADAEARKRQWEQRACALLQTTLGDGVELRQLSELCASLQSTAMTTTATPAAAAAASSAAVTAAQKKTKGRGAAAAAAGDAATAATPTALTLRVTVLNWKLWGYQHAAHMSSDVRERGVQQLTGHTLAPTATTPLPFPGELHAAMQQYERAYAASHTGKQLHWRRAADCYSTFSLAFPNDQGKLTTVHGSLLLHQLYLAIAQYRRVGVSYAVLAARAGDMRVDALAQMLQRHVVKFGLLVKLPPATSNDNNNNNGNNTTASCATAGGVQADERVALNYAYTSPSGTRGVEFVHYPPRISRVSPLDETEMQRVHTERRNKIQVAVIQTMKSAHEMAHAELFAQTRSKLQHSVELHRDVFKLVLDQLMERGYLERANKDAAATVYRYRA